MRKLLIAIAVFGMLTTSVFGKTAEEINKQRGDLTMAKTKTTRAIRQIKAEYKTTMTGWDRAYGDVVTDGVFHHVAAVKVSSGGNATVTFYKDGVRFIPSTDIEHVFGEITMSVSTGGGTADEIRMSTTTRSDDWIWACWASQGGVAGFTTFGSVERFLWGGTTVIMR